MAEQTHTDAAAASSSASEQDDLFAPEHYINRELSLLEFNRRVLAQAQDTDVPLLERLRYLCISSTNLDEFFEVRVAGVRQLVELGATSSGPDGVQPADLLARIHECAHELVEEQYHCLNDDLLPALAEQGIRFLRRGEWTEAQQAWLRDYFEDQLLPALSPMGLDPAHPFPRVLNKSLNFIVSLEGKDAFGRNTGFAVVGAPRALPRIIRLPKEVSDANYDFVFLSSIIHFFVDELFPGMNATGCYQFRVTRNSDLFVDPEEVDDLLRAVEGELSSRRYGDEVRLEVAHNCPDEMCEFLLEQFELDENDLYQVNGAVNFSRISEVINLVDRPDLCFAPFTPKLQKKLFSGPRIFEQIAKKDRLLRLPFDSFLPVVELVRQAASDPQVVAIKQTLYRSGPGSAIVQSLCDAARAGKEVTVVIELRARFDEEENIELANRLHQAGAHVVYGVVGYKTHAKMLLVVRREDGQLRDYVHLGTGNYHPGTARVYTDYGLFSANQELGDDVGKVFRQLTSLGKVSKLKHLLQSPFTLHKAVLAKIARETELAEAGKPAQIIAKMNSLTEPQLVRALYRASQAGVKVDLIIRGICVLKPGVPGLSERIQVRSIIGRFLEHTRVYYFANDGSAELYCASADWMERNLFQRVEVAFPIIDERLQKKVLDDLSLYLNDNRQAWLLQQDGSYQRVQQQPGEPLLAAQDAAIDIVRGE